MTDIRGSLRRRLPLVAVLLVVAATGVAGATLFGGPTADEILDGVEDRYESADTVVGTAEVVATNDSETVSGTVDYVVADDNRSRLTVTGEDRTVVAGSNGTAAWVYDPATGLTETVSNESRAEQAETRYTEFRDRYGDNVTVTRVGTESIDGVATYVLKVNSTNESIDTRGRLWVAQDDFTVQKAETTSEKGTVTVRFTDTRFDVDVHESTFEVPSEDGRTVPGAERESFDSLESARAATELPVPDLRGSYAFEEAVLASYEDTETATVTYDTDAGEVVVGVTTGDRIGAAADEADGETRTVAGRTVTVVESDRGSAVYWTDGERTTAVITRGPATTALDAAERLLD
jgi:outer membrane lipoprotein-sorting protein